MRKLSKNINRDKTAFIYVRLSRDDELVRVAGFEINLVSVTAIL